jgi:hypothetical protein
MALAIPFSVAGAGLKMMAERCRTLAAALSGKQGFRGI